MSRVLRELGVKKIINAAGTLTEIGGSILEDEVIEAIKEAAKCFLDIRELQRKASEVISEISGAEAGMVSSGACAGLALAVCSCMTEGELEKMLKLPDTSEMKNEVIVQRPQRNPFMCCVKMTGARIIMVGSDSMVKEADIINAINEKTAAIIYFYFDPQEGVVPLERVIEIGRERNVPVIVDAAAELPPVENLRKFIGMGADIVVFSGGKDIRAPNDTGIVMGRKKFIDACLSLSSPNTMFGRAMKVSKEDIVALIVALKKYVKEDHSARMKVWNEMIDYMVSELSKVPYISVEKVEAGFGHPRSIVIPRVKISFKRKLRVSLSEFLNELERGDPPLRLYSVGESIYINPHCLQRGEERVVVEALKKALKKHFE